MQMTAWSWRLVSRRMGLLAGGAGVLITLAAAAPPPSHDSVPTFALGEFRGVSAVSATDAWAVGDIGNGQLRTLAARWNGTRWVRVPTPSFGGGDNYLTDVITLSRSNAWAVGFYGTKANNAGVDNTLVLHWDGRRWERVASPSPARPSPGQMGDELVGVSAVSASDIWAVGDAGFQELMEHWDGKRWAVVPVPHLSDGSALSDVSAVSASDIWAVGCGNLSGQASFNLALHWNGHHWASVQVPTFGNPPSSCLTSVSAQSASNAWAITSGSLPTPLSKIMVLHWNGHRWAPVPTPAPVGDLESELNDVTAVSPASAWIVGDVFDGTTQNSVTLIMHWNGSRWTLQASPSFGFSVLYGVSALPGSAAWAVGYDDPGSLALRWNGSHWAPS